MIHNKEMHSHTWLLFFYSVPSKSVSNRMKIWMRLTRERDYHDIEKML